MITPGTFVKHERDANSLGMIIEVRGKGDLNYQILWSKPPDDPYVQYKSIISTTYLGFLKTL